MITNIRCKVLIQSRNFSSIKNNQKFFQDHPLFQYWHKKKDEGHTAFIKTASTMADMKPQCTVQINNEKHVVDRDQTLWQACEQAGQRVPRFCFHEKLAVAGNCRMCLVQTSPRGFPTVSCTSKVMEGMEIFTESKKSNVMRGHVMEQILANHPLDCPICDQGGECDLQDQSRLQGFYFGRFQEQKRAVEDKDIGPLVQMHMNRCIQCSRCVRFLNQYGGCYDLGMLGRGNAAQIDTYIQKNIDSELSGNIVDLCPVGALTNGPYSMSARPWELALTESIDILESVNASTHVFQKGGDLMRVLPKVHEETNEDWISDKTRHGWEGVKRQRLNTCQARGEDGEFLKWTWEKSMSMLVQKINQLEDKNQLVGLVGHDTDLETCVAFRDLFHNIGSDNIDVIGDQVPKVNQEFRNEYLMNSRITGLDQSDCVVLIGCDLSKENPLLEQRLRRSFKENHAKIFVLGAPKTHSQKYFHLGSSTRTINQLFEGDHPLLDELKNSTNPTICVGNDILTRADGRDLVKMLEKVAKESNVIREDWNGFNIMLRESSRAGAYDIGLGCMPDKQTKLSNAKIVYLLGADKITVPQIPEDAFVVYQGHHGDEGAYYADLILPGMTFMEKDSTQVNLEGRPQINRKVGTSPGIAREDWRILRALSEELGCTLPQDDIHQIRARASLLAPHTLKLDNVEDTTLNPAFFRPKNYYDNLNVQVSPIEDTLDNQQMTDSISRNSVTMGRCSRLFNREKNRTFNDLNRKYY